MAEKRGLEWGIAAQKRVPASNVKKTQKYERFGEAIRYMTWEEWLRFLSSIDNYPYKLMMRTIYELGCRVGEFVRIRLRDVDFARGRVFFPREHTKTGRRRVSHFSPSLCNDLKTWLQSEGRMTARRGIVRKSSEYLFSPARSCSRPYSENRLRQIFRRFLQKAQLERIYGRDSKGRKLSELTVHSLRHTHIMHYIHLHKLPIAVVQKQVGHTSLKTTSVYLNPSDEAVGDAYRIVQEKVSSEHHNL